MGTDLSDHSGLEGLWTDYPNRTVPALPVVVQFNVLEHLSSHGLPRFESLTMDRLDLEAVKEVLGTGIVVAVGLGAYVTPCRPASPAPPPPTAISRGAQARAAGSTLCLR